MEKFSKENFGELMKWLNLAFLFLFSVHLFGFPDKYIILWCAFAIAVFWFQNRRLCLDKVFWILALAILLNGLGTYYYLRETLSYTWKDIFKMVIPTILVYPFMKQAAWGKEDEDIEKILMAIVFGTFVYSMLNYYMFWRDGYMIIEGAEGGRNWSDFWTHYGWRATHYSYWGCFIAGFSGYALYLLLEKKWIHGIFYIVLIILENAAQIAVDNRMVICVTAVSLGVSLVMFCYFNIKNKDKIKKALLAAMAVVVCVALILALDLFGVRSSGYFQRFLTRNGGILRNDRFQIMFEAIKLLPSHWMGGGDMWAAGYQHVHNYWLQVANVSGIIPLILWTIVNISVVCDMFRLLRSPEISMKLKYRFLPLMIAIICYFMMEPGGTESNWFIIFYVLLIALLKQMVNQPNRKKVEK